MGVRGLYPIDLMSTRGCAGDALEKLRLNDSAFPIRTGESAALGFDSGADSSTAASRNLQERLEREFQRDTDRRHRVCATE